MRVDIEYVLRLKEELRKINEIRLEKIEWYKNGSQIDISQDIIDEFIFTGLSNVDFITTGYYNDGVITIDGKTK
jgi:hypothetical protein